MAISGTPSTSTGDRPWRRTTRPTATSRSSFRRTASSLRRRSQTWAADPASIPAPAARPFEVAACVAVPRGRICGRFARSERSDTMCASGFAVSGHRSNAYGSHNRDLRSQNTPLIVSIDTNHPPASNQRVCSPRAAQRNTLTLGVRRHYEIRTPLNTVAWPSSSAIVHCRLTRSGRGLCRRGRWQPPTPESVHPHDYLL